MRKKLLTMFLAGAMMLSITACGGKETEETTNIVDKTVVEHSEAEQSDVVEDAKENELLNTAVEVAIQGNAKREFFRNPEDTVVEVLTFDKVICDRTIAEPTFCADHIPEGATGIVIEFEMNGCNVEFDEVMWYAEFATDVKTHSLLETTGMPQYEGNGTYRAVLNFSEYAPNETFKQLNMVRVDWHERNNTISEKEVAGEFVLTKVFFYTGNDIEEVTAEMIALTNN